MTTPGEADYGTDLYGVDDIDPNMREVTGVEVLRQAVARRLMTPRGWLLDDPTYGYDTRAHLSDTLDTAKLLQIQSAIRAEVLKDPRVLTCTVRVELTGTRSALVLRLSLDGESREGPYDLVVDVSKVTATLLQSEGA